MQAGNKMGAESECASTEPSRFVFLPPDFGNGAPASDLNEALLIVLKHAIGVERLPIVLWVAGNAMAFEVYPSCHYFASSSYMLHIYKIGYHEISNERSMSSSNQSIKSWQRVRRNQESWPLLQQRLFRAQLLLFSQTSNHHANPTNEVQVFLRVCCDLLKQQP
jgi:hypothetical protein